MIKLSAMNIDYYDSMEEFDLADKLEMSDLIKNASLLDKNTIESLPDDMFAVVMMTKTGSVYRKFPLVDKDHTWLSNRYFNKVAYSLPYRASVVAASNIKQACGMYKIQPSEKVVKLAASVPVDPKVSIDEKKAVSIYSQVDNNPPVTVNYAVRLKTPDSIKSLYPLNSKDNVIKAINYLKTNMNTMPNDIIKEFATNLAKASKLYSVTVPDEILNIAINKPGNKAYVNIMTRKALASKRKVKEAIQDIAQRSNKLPAEKTAELIRKVDEFMGFKKYSSLVPCPYKLVSENWTKEAAKTPVEFRINDVYNKDDLEAYIHSNYDKLTEELPSDVVDKLMAKPVETYKSMTEVQQKVIKDGMSER